MNSEGLPAIDIFQMHIDLEKSANNTQKYPSKYRTGDELLKHGNIRYFSCLHGDHTRVFRNLCPAEKLTYILGNYAEKLSMSILSTAYPDHPADSIEASYPDHIHTWRPLFWLNIYRFVLSLFLVGYLLSSGDESYIGKMLPDLAKHTSVIYLLFSSLTFVTIRMMRPDFIIQVHMQVMVDITLLTLLMHASGGIQSGLGMFINIVIAGGAIVVPGRNANLFASLASLALLAEQASAYFSSEVPTNYPQAGILGVSFFATATLAYVLARRIRASEALASQRGADLANMAELNEHIIQQMDSGVIVIDHRLTVRHANRAASRMLAKNNILYGQKLINIAPELATAYQQWRVHQQPQNRDLHVMENGRELHPQFILLGSHDESGILIFLEDISDTLHQAQQMKLASLGRLTASIAHEIRNPLGAISHAGQLLGESTALPPADQRLAQIIQNHTQRVNVIIENILQLSRRDHFAPQSIALIPWLDKFVDEFTTDNDLPADSIQIIGHSSLTIVMDPSQLHQVINNIASNALRYCVRTQSPWIKLLAGVIAERETPYLDIIDNGPGIPAHFQANIFEPFFTTENTGTGLGLYISKELCAINKAKLAYFITKEGESCFRIYFSNHQHV